MKFYLKKTEDLIIRIAVPFVLMWLSSIYISYDLKVQYILLWTAVFGVIHMGCEMLGKKAILFAIEIYIFVMEFIFWIRGYEIKTLVLIFVINIVVLLVERIIRNIILRMILEGVCVGALFYAFFSTDSIPKALIALTFVLLLNFLGELLTKLGINKKSGQSLVVIYFIIGVLTFLSPTSDKPYDWAFFTKIFDGLFDICLTIGETVESIFFWEGSGYSFSSYDEELRLDGNATIDNYSCELTLFGENTSNNMYLIGNICNTYDGKEWTYKGNATASRRELDTWMSLYACYALLDDPLDMHEIIEVKEQTITYKDIATSSIFLPGKEIKYGNEENAINTKNVGDNIRISGIKRNGFSYSYVFINFDYEDELLKSIIKKSKDIKYSSQTFSQLKKFMKKEFDVSTYLSYEHFIEEVNSLNADINNTYLAVYGLSTQAKQYGKNVCEEAKNNLNSKNGVLCGDLSALDKAYALRNEIRKISYNKKTVMPQNVNIIDYYLFEAKEGYCIHSATTLVELLRNEGIPARIVEGFYVDYGLSDESRPYQDNDNQQSIDILGNDAHAWAEAYFDGFGWVRLDATGAMPLSSFGYKKDSQSGADTPSEAVDYETGSTNDYQDDYEDLKEEESDSDEASLDDINHEKSIKRVYQMIVVVSGAILLVVIVLVLLYMLQYYYVYNSYNPDVIIEELLRLIGKKTGKKMDNETVEEFFNTRGNEYTTLSNKELINLIEKHWYSNESLTEQEVLTLRSVMRECKKNAKV